MTQDGGQRVAIADGAMLADTSSLGNVVRLATPGSVAERIFDPAFWAACGGLEETTRGRGSAWFISTPGAASEAWVLRHYRRGGVVAQFSADRYVWAGEDRVRAFAEWRLLAVLWRRGLPVPQPIAARYQRRGCIYRCDLITRRIPHALPLSECLTKEPVSEAGWHATGKAVAELHSAGADHADLNAHNILRDSADFISIIDFDRGRLRQPLRAATSAAWATRNLSRLKRSLAKITRELPADRFGARQWRWLLDGYARAPPL